MNNHTDGIRVQPHSIEAEEGLIAALLLDGGNSILADCRAMKLTAESLYGNSNKLIFKALCEMDDAESAIDEITLLDHLGKSGDEEDIGGIAGIYAIQNRIETPAHARYHAKIVMDKHLHRLIIRSSREITESCYDQSDDPQVIAGKAEEIFRSIADSKAGDEDTMLRADTLVDLALQRIEEMKNDPEGAEEEITRTGISALDDALAGGFRDSQLIVVGARPSVGKSAVSGNIAEYNAVEEGKAVAIFSLEMTGPEMITRLGCSRAQVDSIKVGKGLANRSEEKSLSEAYTNIHGADLYVDDAPGVNILDIRRKCHQLNQKLARQGKRLRLVVIDYAQIVEGVDSKAQRSEQVGYTTRIGKRMAKELKCPVVILSQLNREGNNTGAEPRLSNLRESGELEQDADIVILMHRKPPSSNSYDQGVSPEVDDIDLIIAKQRNGPLSTVPTNFVRRFCRFQDK